MISQVIYSLKNLLITLLLTMNNQRMLYMHIYKGFLSPSKPLRLGIKIVPINIVNETAVVIVSGVKVSLFSLHASSSYKISATEFHCQLVFQRAIFRKSHFQLSNQNHQSLEVI